MAPSLFSWQDYEGDQEEHQTYQSGYVERLGRSVPGVEVLRGVSHIPNGLWDVYTYEMDRDNPSLDTVYNRSGPSRSDQRVRRICHPQL